MNYKIFFTDGSWRIVDADVYSLDDKFLVFLKADQPVLSCITNNVLFWEPLAAETPRQEPRHDIRFR